MNPLAQPFAFNGGGSLAQFQPAASSQYPYIDESPAETRTTHDDQPVESKDVTGLARSEASADLDTSEDDFHTHIIHLAETPRTQPHPNAAELTTLRAANAALKAHLRTLEAGTPAEREARSLKTKNAEIDDLKASHERVLADTEEVKKKLAERQTYLSDLKAQIAELQPPLHFAVKDRRRGRVKGKGLLKGEDGGESRV